ncbi:hypothetical protein GCM10012278_84980 [Nonomuraea glycinis]|uniref:Uncharacterized protein n=1 Tax=Nonomuraea glycinis TaxID=2047744 RepID=A0A918ADR8_9ACTN|nr:hypothetical protein GCM10012278_84980 [Nonomuraea glycinis]
MFLLSDGDQPSGAPDASGVEHSLQQGSAMLESLLTRAIPGLRFTGVIVTRVGSSVEYDGNTPDHRHREMTSGGTPLPGRRSVAMTGRQAVQEESPQVKLY